MSSIIRRKVIINRIGRLIKYFAAFTTPILFILFIITLYFFLEYDVFSFEDVVDTIWFTIVTMTTTGYGDIVPKTFWGRVIAVGFMFIGIIVVSFFTGAVSSFLVSSKLLNRKEIKRLSKMKNHTLILGYKEDLHLLIKDILTYESKLSPSDIVLVNNIDNSKTKIMLSSNGLADVGYIDGDYSDENVLIGASVKKAKKAIVLADGSSSNDAESIDAKTVVVVMMLKSLNPDIYICAEALTEKYKNHLNNFKCDEVIYGSQYTRFMFSTSVSYAGITKVIDKLLNRSKGSILMLDHLDNAFIGEKFETVFEEYKERTGKIVIGVIENIGDEHKLKEEAIAEARKTSDIDDLLQKLKDARSIEKNHAIINPHGDYILKKYSALVVINQYI